MACETHSGNLTSSSEMVALADSLQPNLIVIGPENPLVSGLADNLRASGHTVFGPGAAGARLEASKAYTKQVLDEVGAPTAKHRIVSDFESGIRAAEAFFASGSQVAVKASGAALGKGVVVCESLELASEAISELMVERLFGEAGSTLVIEERLFGREFSLLTICSERGFWSLPVAQDYKRIGDGDAGPMTGGMGTYSPTNWVTRDVVSFCEERVVRPTLAHLQGMGVAFRGVLFSGFMLTDEGPKCLEFNVRFGDPETQSIVRRLGTGLLRSLLSAACGEAPIPCSVDEGVFAVTVVLANAGYPGPVACKPLIHIQSPLPEGVEIFHAGTSMIDGRLVATGGRVLNVSAVGRTLDEARRSAYDATSAIQFDGMQFRRDIAAISPENVVH